MDSQDLGYHKAFHFSIAFHMIMLNSDALIPAVGKWQIGNRKPVNPIKDIWITSVAKC
jgi:hypothetical protein